MTLKKSVIFVLLVFANRCPVVIPAVHFLPGM